jgi:glutamate racemase
MSVSASSPIAIFDSGIGGLNVLHEAVKQIGGGFIYYADTEHVPYGEKTREEVHGYISDAVAFLAKKNIKALVLACNTATSISVEKLRSQYSFPIFGMEPAVKPAVERTKGKRVLVLATLLTLKEQKFNDLVSRVDNANIVDRFACPELVEFAESFEMNNYDVMYTLMQKLHKPRLEDYGTVVLGCTHFPYFKKAIAALFPGADIIDGTEGTVRHLKNILEKTNLLPENKKGHITYYDSGKQIEDESRFNKYIAYIKAQEEEDLLGKK